jgi:PadR family transcriptional regulator, regulatory protein PadR
MPTSPEQPRSDKIGHFEQLILTAIIMLGGEDYGVPIYDRVCELAGKRVNQGSLYLTLDHLEEKGMLASRLSDPAKEPRGRPKRYYRLEPAGFQALEETVENAKRLSEIFDDNSGTIKKWLKKRTRQLSISRR